MHKLYFFTLIFCLTFAGIFAAFAQVPTQWQSRGIGGGGALFAASFNPANDNEFYVGCDMSELFHSTDFGNTYQTIPFTQTQGGHNATVRFTSNPNILYTVDYTTTLAIQTPRPAKSTDGGATWTALTGNPDPSEETYGIWADYNNPNRVIIAYYGTLYLSNDGGNTFNNIHNAISNGSGCLVGGVFFDGNNIYIGTNDGVLVSTNGGTNFTTAPLTGLPANELIFSFAAAKQGSTIRFFALTGSVGNLYVGMMPWDYWGFLQNVYSLDYNTSTVWTPQMTGINPANDFLMFVAMPQNDINTCYIGGSNSSSELNVVKTINGGASWSHVFNTASNQNLYTGWCGTGGDRGWSYAESVFSIAVSPQNGNKVIITDFGFVHKTADGGATWHQSYIAASNENAAGSNTPLYHSYTGIGLENTTCWQTFWIDEQNMYAGFSDIKGIRSTDAGNSWSFNYTGHNENSMYRIVKNISSNTLYIATASVHDLYQSTRLADAQLDAASNTGSVKYSTNNGASWQVLHDFSDIVAWVATNPNNANQLYASVVNSANGNGGVWVSNNINLGAASTWTKLPNPPRTEGHPFNIIVLNDGKVVASYSGHRDPGFTASSGVFLYDPTTNTWADRSAAGLYYWTKDVVIDPNDATQNTWYAGVFSGWGGAANGLGGLYRTTNRGTSWTRINNLDRVTSCTISPNNPNEAYITTEVDGLWHTNNLNNASPNFTVVSSYPFRQPERVFFNPYNASEIWITSFGNGLRVGNASTCTLTPLITGTNSTCTANSYTYSVAPIAGSTYNWTVTNGTITAGQGTNQITVQWISGTAGTVNVEQTTP